MDFSRTCYSIATRLGQKVEKEDVAAEVDLKKDDMNHVALVMCTCVVRINRNGIVVDHIRTQSEVEDKEWVSTVEYRARWIALFGCFVASNFECVVALVYADYDLSSRKTL
ncbi:unnamed protein product [Dovyalis caffra]|uniref:Uncharacterized protein n=1 Tax=Dovyalis caffra TaxID=77055 RepID=A0AAV1S0Q1_9ROSI|nr:unnamed protein product [Dovyalis caffra]